MGRYMSPAARAIAAREIEREAEEIREYYGEPLDEEPASWSRPFMHRAHVSPDIGGFVWHCNCGRKGELNRDPEAARADAIVHVKTHEHHEAAVRVLGVDK